MRKVAEGQVLDLFTGVPNDCETEAMLKLTDIFHTYTEAILKAQLEEVEKKILSWKWRKGFIQGNVIKFGKKSDYKSAFFDEEEVYVVDKGNITNLSQSLQDNKE